MNHISGLDWRFGNPFPIHALLQYLQDVALSWMWCWAPSDQGERLGLTVTDLSDSTARAGVIEVEWQGQECWVRDNLLTLDQLWRVGYM